jgi:SAM-dependent methyltransferase/FKBP-type peptidyl-prolyl cis-trans isomerase 2
MSEVIDSKSLATLHSSLAWQSDVAKHVETFYVPLNVWRELELLPSALARSLSGQRAGAVITASFAPGSLVPAHNASQVKLFPQDSFTHGQRPPRLGRFYPRGLLLGYAQNPLPFRCKAFNGDGFFADLNHPLASQTLELKVTVADVHNKKSDTGGECRDWLQIICDGPGMQARESKTPTDFFSDDPFARPDAQDDTRFYKKPRLVNHIDNRADATIRGLYERLLKPGARVLDLMSSWNSHLPDTLELGKVTGLGLNREELVKNPRLTDYVVHDLNSNPVLAFGDQEFEAVICTVSVEYLIHPEEIFQEVARILKPGGLFIHTFSNRWFPPKVIKIWTELMEWERPGLVLEYFLRSGAYNHLQTFSARGWPRPANDRYFPQVPLSDPVYAVWGQTRT